jgi:hypothetical protein
MTQNSIYDRNFPSGVLFPARSSPLVCAADALDVLLRLLSYMYAGASAPVAARRIVQERIWQPSPSIAVATAADDDNNNDEEAAETAESPLTLGDQHPRAHIVLFVLGVLPQAIKLFGMHGIPWTQACGGLYLSSFLVIAGVGALARRAERDADADTSREGPLDKLMMAVWDVPSIWVVAVVQAGVWVWCVWALLLLLPVWDMKAKAPVLYFILSTPAWVMFGFIVRGPMIRAFYYLFLWTILIPTTLGKIAYFAFSASLAVLYLYGVRQFLDFLIREVYLQFSAYVLVAAFFATKVVPRHLLMIFFALVNLVLFILYYRFRYDPTGTVKPLWVEKLG